MGIWRIMKAIVVFLLFVYLSHAQPCKKKPGICNTKSCTIASANLLQSLDDQVNPCQDFYRFACGGFLKKTLIPEGQTKVNRFTQLEDKVKVKLKKLFEKVPVTKEDPKAFENVRSFYQSCIDKEKASRSLADLKTMIASIGGWPLLEGEKWDDGEFRWNELEKKLIQSGLGQNGFIETYVNIDKNNPSNISLSIYEPFLGLDREELESSNLDIDGFNNTQVKNYFNFLFRQAVLLGADEEQAKVDVREGIKFLNEIDRIKFRNIVAVDYNDTWYDDEYEAEIITEHMTITELTEIYPEINWNDLLAAHLDDIDVSLDDNVTIIVENPDYLIKLRSLISTVPSRVLANFLFGQSMAKWMDELVEINDDFKEIWREFHNEKQETQVQPPLWEICVHSTSSTLPIAVSSMFVRKYVNVTSKTVMEKMVTDITNEFKRMLKKSDWMDKVTKKRAREKVDLINSFIAYPDELLNDALIDDYYADLQMTKKSFILNKIRNSKFLHAKKSKKLIDPDSTKVWDEKAYFVPEVQASYSNLENSIKFPAGILDEFFFGVDLPHYLNYGGIGFVIGHEITHGFDDEGSEYDGKGLLIDWWEQDTKDKYANRTNCMVDQYGSQKELVDGVNMAVNGKLTQGENIADNAGLKAAYRTYQRLYTGREDLLPGMDYSANQLLWMSVANVWCQVMTTNEEEEFLLYDPHSPPRVRINTLLGNMKEFSQDWGCKAGDEMNPVNKCNVW